MRGVRKQVNTQMMDMRYCEISVGERREVSLIETCCIFVTNEAASRVSGNGAGEGDVCKGGGMEQGRGRAKHWAEFGRN